MSNLYDISTYLRYAASADAEEKRRVAEEERQIAAHKLYEAQMTPGTPEYEVYRGGGDMGSYPIAELASMVVGGGAAGGAARLAKMAYQPGKLVTNIPQNLKGHYSGGVGAKPGSAAIGFGKGVINSLRQYISPQASSNFNVAGLSHGTQKIVANGLRKMDELASISKSRKLTPEEAADYTTTGKEVHGQLGYHYLIGKQGGAKIPILEQWKDANYHTIGHFTRDEFKDTKQYATEIGSKLSDKSMDEAYDIISGTWKSAIRKSPLDENTLMAVKKSRGPRFAGVHDNDAFTSSSGKLMKDVLTANGKDFGSVDDLARAFEAVTKNPDVKMYIVKKSDDGIWVQFSPERGSGFVEGGTNALIKIQPDRKIHLFTTDEHDMVGLIPPGYDRMVTVLPAWGVDFFRATRGAKTAGGVRTPKAERDAASARVRDAIEGNSLPTRATGSTSTKTTLPVFTKDQRAAAQAVADFKAPVNYGRFARRRGVPLAMGGLLYAGTRE
tara:strand:- start:2324 stop:3817 length:1494 start_codon:yes stop_codon:yes gene_type:complete